MLSPSDFNNAVPQFTNGNYASNPINPQYVEEPTSTDYNHGVEPLQTLPAQWWNWFLNKFTARFNKVNVYVKNIFNELAQLLSLFGMTPDGTEGTPTTEQLKTAFCSCYPSFVKSCITGTACGCVPTIGVAMGSTDGNIVATDANGNLKPTGISVGTAAGCDASCFMPSDTTILSMSDVGASDTDIPLVLCTGTANVGKSSNCQLTFNPSTGVLTANAFCGFICGTTEAAQYLCGVGLLEKYKICVPPTLDMFIPLCGYRCGALPGCDWESYPVKISCSDKSDCSICATCANRVHIYDNAVCICKQSSGSCTCCVWVCNLCSFPVIALGGNYGYCGSCVFSGVKYLTCCQKWCGCGSTSSCTFSTKVPAIRVY